MTEQNNSIFRKESVERISSPEQLNDYIRVSSPGVWLVLSAVIVLLVAMVVWSVFGTVESYINVCVVSDGETMLCYVTESDKSRTAEGQQLYIDGKEYTLGEALQPVGAKDALSEYAMHVGSFKKGEWAYPYSVNTTLPAGTYTGMICVERIHPYVFAMSRSS